MDFLAGNVQVLFREVGKLNWKVQKMQRDVRMVNGKLGERQRDVQGERVNV